ncbi:MAG: alkaline phosphatase family protein [Ignavibacteriales bacterium]|nr:alkaline phosphatase family protein [Ignavibacteriales bacterium]
MKIKILILSLVLIPLILFSQEKNEPKLVVGIVVDQMRYDYLEKFYDDFSENGFKKLINDGSNFTNCKINYVPTVTGAGHASIYTGTTPYYHGIITNDWKDRNTGDNINCVTAINNYEGKVGEGISIDRSPERLLSTTIGDQIKLNNFGKSKVISISLKDRAAMLPAGKSADAAYWFDDKTGRFITSFYYLKELPSWVTNFNNSGKVNSYLDKDWNLLKPIDAYKDLPEDNSPYETDVFNEGRTSFPHTLNNVKEEDKISKMTHTPNGNQIIIDFVKEALANENLGKGKYLDHLAISFSSPDKIGHDYGPQSYEVKDTYLRLDLQIAELLNMLEAQVGKGNFILFLTADHGVMPNTKHLNDMKIDAGVLENTNYFEELEDFLLEKYQSNKIIKTRFSYNIYLDFDEIEKLKLNRAEVENTIKDFLIFNVPEITEVYTRSELDKMTASRSTHNFLLNGFNKKRSGDILFSLQAYYLNWKRDLGATHGSEHEYDNHIPLIFYGNDIRVQRKNEEVYIEDIAPTITDFIGINKPSDSIGIPLLKKN